MRRVPVTGWLLLICLLCGCGRTPQAKSWISQSLELSSRADQALEHSDREDARASLRVLATREAPSAVAAADARAVRQDACFRLALLDLEEQRPSEAERWAELGLSLGLQDDLFTGNLLVARARARQGQGDDQHAVEDFHRALLINESLLDQTLREARHDSHNP